MSEVTEKACVYASLILADEGLDITVRLSIFIVGR
jgi:hypothetical protein